MYKSREEIVEKLQKLAMRKFRLPVIHALRLKGLMLKLKALEVK